jgi:CIC family chloride channel protein
MRPAVGGLVTGGLAVLALAVLRSDGITGGGYGALSNALAGSLALKTLAVLCLLKLIATVSSYSSGGAGGIFAPTLFIGGMAGGAMGVFDRAVFHHPASSLSSFALVGMGAVFAGTIRAPITSVLIIVEMTGGYSLILPLMIANMSAYVLARHVRPTPIYEALLAQDGIHLPSQAAMQDLDGMSLSQVPLESRPHVTLALRSGATAMAAQLAGVRQQVFPVVDGERLVGIIRIEDVASLKEDAAMLEGVVNASDLMHPPISVRRDEDLKTAVEVMMANDLRELPVVDEELRVVGFVDESAIARAYMLARKGSKAAVTPA